MFYSFLENMYHSLWSFTLHLYASICNVHILSLCKISIIIVYCQFHIRHIRPSKILHVVYILWIGWLFKKIKTVDWVWHSIWNWTNCYKYVRFTVITDFMPYILIISIRIIDIPVYCVKCSSNITTSINGTYMSNPSNNQIARRMISWLR